MGLLGPVESISIEEMKQVFETNFFGVVRMIKEVMPDMKKRRSGHIVVISSVMGLQGLCFWFFQIVEYSLYTGDVLRIAEIFCLYFSPQIKSKMLLISHT